MEGAHAGTGGAQGTVHVAAHFFFTADDRAAQSAALAVDVFGGGGHHDVRSQIQRPLQGRGAHGVVHHQQAIMLTGQRRQGGDVRHLGEGVGRRLQEQPSGVGAYRLAPGVEIGERHIAGVDAELAQIIIEQDDGTAEHAVAGDDMVAALQQAQSGGEDGGHARTGGHGALAPLHGGDALLEHPHRGIGEAGIDIARLFAGEARRRFRRAGEHKAGGGEDGLALLALLGTHLAGVHRQGFRGIFLVIIGLGHPPLLSTMSKAAGTKKPAVSVH